MYAQSDYQRISYPSKKLNNSWFIQWPNENFSGSCIMGICKCCEISFFDSKYQHILGNSMICQKCRETIFLDTEQLLNLKSSIYFKKFEWSYEYYVEDNIIHSIAYYHMPIIDVHNMTVKFNKKVLYHLAIDFNGRVRVSSSDSKMLYSKVLHESNFVAIGDILAQPIAKNLNKLIYQTFPKRFETIHTQMKEYGFDAIEEADVLRFFLKYPQINDIALFYFKRSFLNIAKDQRTLESVLSGINNEHTKCVKKQTCQNALHFISQAKHIHRYDPVADYLFCKYFKDENFAYSLCKLDYELKNLLFSSCDFSSLEIIFELLFLNYEAIRIKRFLYYLILNAKTNSHDWHDLLNMINLQGFKQILKDHYHPHKLNLQNLHDYILDLYIPFYKECDTKPFKYEQLYMQASKKHNDFYYRLPETPVELTKWGWQMRNCVASYSKKIRHNNAVYGIYYKDKLSYILYTDAIKIIQVKGFANKSVPRNAMKEIQVWFEMHFSSK